VNRTPLGYLDAAGTRAHSILPLTWTMLIISIVVCVVIGCLLWIAVRRAQASGGSLETRAVPVESGESGTRWIGIGLLISAVPILVTFVWTMVALAATSGPPRDPGLTIDVTAHQWWWEVRYPSPHPAESFVTANEIHIPVGVPVLVRLHGGDVIHSFWVPKLSGKTDAIPGQINLSWLQADVPGRYRGQCSEYCGPQHAHMAFEVVAEPRADFARWRAAELAAAPPPTSESQTRGLSIVEYRCGLCHTVRGTTAGAVSAPDLTHVMSRRLLAAGWLPNNPGNLSGWIESPQQIKPGSLMPDQGLSADQLNDVRAYVETLQ